MRAAAVAGVALAQGAIAESRRSRVGRATERGQGRTGTANWGALARQSFKKGAKRGASQHLLRLTIFCNESQRGARNMHVTDSTSILRALAQRRREIKGKRRATKRARALSPQSPLSPPPLSRLHLHHASVLCLGAVSDNVLAQIFPSLRMCKTRGHAGGLAALFSSRHFA